MTITIRIQLAVPSFSRSGRPPPPSPLPRRGHRTNNWSCVMGWTRARCMEGVRESGGLQAHSVSPGVGVSVIASARERVSFNVCPSTLCKYAFSIVKLEVRSCPVVHIKACAFLSFVYLLSMRPTSPLVGKDIHQIKHVFFHLSSIFYVITALP